MFHLHHDKKYVIINNDFYAKIHFHIFLNLPSFSLSYFNGVKKDSVRKKWIFHINGKLLSSSLDKTARKEWSETNGLLLDRWIWYLLESDIYTRKWLINIKRWSMKAIVFLLKKPAYFCGWLSVCLTFLIGWCWALAVRIWAICAIASFEFRITGITIGLRCVLL